VLPCSFARASSASSSAELAKSRPGRNVVHGDLTIIPDASDREDFIALNCEQKPGAGIGDPGGDILRCLVGQPPGQDFRIVAMIGDAEF